MHDSNLLDKIEKIYGEISSREVEKKHMLLQDGIISETDRVTQECLDYSDLYIELKDIMILIFNNYRQLLRTKYKDITIKVYFVALCEMIKQDYNRGMLITFKSALGLPDINTNRYYDLIGKVSNGVGLELIESKGRTLYEQTYILETGVPKNLVRDVINMFKIYWRYFRNINKIERTDAIRRYLYGKLFEKVYIIDPSDEKIFEAYRDCLSEFPEKAFRVMEKLDCIFCEIDKYENFIDLQEESFNRSIKEISLRVGYDITSILRNSDLRNIYFSYMSLLTISKFKKIILNLGRNEIIVNPRNRSFRAVEFNINNIWCGEYIIRNIKYAVVIDPVITLDDMLSYECNVIRKISDNYYMYISRDDFEVEVDYKVINTRYLYYRGQERYVWIGRVPASCRAYIDGNWIESTEKCKINFNIVKYYDRETKKNSLRLLINMLKVNINELPYKCLQLQLNDKEKIGLTYGNPEGIFICYNHYVEIDDSREQNLTFHIEDKKIYETAFKLDDILLFDKWNGTRYYENSNNCKHSGAFIVFLDNKIKIDKFPYEVRDSYNWLNYSVVEFVTTKDCLSINISSREWQFKRNGKPFFVMHSDDSELQGIAESFKGIVLKIYNQKLDTDYWIQIENELISKRIKIKDETEYNVEILVNEFKGELVGDWWFSLWEKQHKIDEEKLIIVPRLKVSQIDPITMEGKDVCVNVKASVPCFSSEVGDFSYESIFNIGQAILNVQNNYVYAEDLSSFIYNDKYEIMQKITVNPKVWGVRTKRTNINNWECENTIILDNKKTNNVLCFICSTQGEKLSINGKEYNVVPGLNKLKWKEFFSCFKAKNELIISDYKDKYNLTLGLLPSFHLIKEIVNDESLIVMFSYKGPVDENINITIYIDNELIRNQLKHCYQNSFSFSLLVGKLGDLKGKKVCIYYKRSTSGIPESIYEKLIDEHCELFKDNNKSIDKNNYKTNCLEDFDKLKEYTIVDNLSKVYYKKSDISNKVKNLDDLIKNLMEV